MQATQIQIIQIKEINPYWKQPLMYDTFEMPDKKYYLCAIKIPLAYFHENKSIE